MIKKIFFNVFLILILLLILLLFTLSTVGIETNRFNKLISNKVSQTKNIKIDLKTINFKLDFKELSLFIETKQPKIEYSNLVIPAQSVKVYIDFLNLIQTNLNIKKINLKLRELDVTQLNNLSQFIKPSNFKSILINKIKDGKLISEVEIFFNKEGVINDYIIKGSVRDLEAKIYNELNLSKTNFGFFADKDDVLFKNIFGKIDGVEIENGDIKLNLENGIKLNSNFISKISLDIEKIKRLNGLTERFKLLENIKDFDGNFNNSVFVNLDKTYKITNYDYKFFGSVDKSKIELSNPLRDNYYIGEVKEIFLKDAKVNLEISNKNYKMSTVGKYSFNNLDFLQLDLESSFINNSLKINTNFDYNKNFDLNLINYKKPEDKIAKISIEFEKNKNIAILNKLYFREKNNFINIQDLKFKDNNFESVKKINIRTSNNDFSVHWNKKIKIKGNKFDASNLPQLLNQQNASNKFKNINSNIEIDFKNIKAPLSEKLENFRLIGEVKKGKFIKISSKGDFGGNNYLDISLKNNKDSDKKFLEIYSDLTRPLLTEYSFFKGLTGGKLLFTSLIDGSKSNSKLKIENFKVVNAPGVIKLLSLADLGGLADLVEGEGLSFDLLEIDMEKDKNILKLNEILALGPSMSVLIEGYQDNKGLTSLKGTLVPAKNLNKMISKIPVIGSIVIPKEVGEGLFGISFKMKGPKGNIKTTINPIRTLTPRFIQKIVDKNKISK